MATHLNIQVTEAELGKLSRQEAVSIFVAARTTIVPHGVGHGRSAWQQDHAAHGKDARRHAKPL
jgi:hypothetical protein